MIKINQNAKDHAETSGALGRSQEHRKALALSDVFASLFSLCQVFPSTR
jgi:hypothetical protein